MINVFSLEGKAAIVTGARRGLGRGIAVSLAQSGADIVGVGTGDCSDVKAEVEALGRKFVWVHADLTYQHQLDEIVETCMQAFGRLDILVNNAGIIRRNDSLDFTEKDWDDVMNINVKTVFFLSQRVARIFVSQGHGGKIINVASMMSYQGGIRVPSYTSSKNAIKGLTMTLANEWAKYGINVNAVAPGYMVTDITETLQKDPVRNQEILNHIPNGRWGTPEDLGPTVVFLASEASAYINGFTVCVDGGYQAR